MTTIANNMKPPVIDVEEITRHLPPGWERAHNRESIIKAVLAALGIGAAGYVAIKTLKYFLGPTVVIVVGGVVVTHVITGTMLKMAEIHGDHDLKAAKITADLEKTERDADRELLVNQQTIAIEEHKLSLKKAELEEQKRKDLAEQRVAVAGEIERKCQKASAYLDHLKAECKSLTEWWERPGSGAEDGACEKLNRLHLVRREIPDAERALFIEKEQIRHDVLWAYNMLPEQNVVVPEHKETAPTFNPIMPTASEVNPINNIFGQINSEISQQQTAFQQRYGGPGGVIFNPVIVPHHGGPVHVNSYERSNGTYVHSYNRSAPGTGRSGGRR